MLMGLGLREMLAVQARSKATRERERERDGLRFLDELCSFLTFHTAPPHPPSPVDGNLAPAAPARGSTSDLL